MTVDSELAQVRAWVARRSSTAADWSPPDLVAAKDGRRVSVVLPARDEQDTIGEIVTRIRTSLVRRWGLVDEILVVDSRSRDATAAVAARAGAVVVHQDAVCGTARHGKGVALWAGLAAAGGDLVAFVDADLRAFRPHVVTGLLGPLLADPAVGYVKGFYHRPLVQPGGVEPDGGGRVTELVARPLLNLFWPQLAGFVQPLVGEYAGRRELLERVPFVCGYGVETGLLIDLLGLVGVDGLAQVDLGVRRHRHQPTDALGRMATEIMLTALSRLRREGRLDAALQPVPWLVQFQRGDSGDGIRRALAVHEFEVAEQPPLASVRPSTLTAASGR